MDPQEDFVKKMPLPEYCSLAVSRFFTINHAENFKRVFLKTIFFETATTITKKVYGESS